MALAALCFLAANVHMRVSRSMAKCFLFLFHPERDTYSVLYWLFLYICDNLEWKLVIFAHGSRRFGLWWLDPMSLGRISWWQESGGRGCSSHAKQEAEKRLTPLKMGSKEWGTDEEPATLFKGMWLVTSFLPLKCPPNISNTTTNWHQGL